jgi:hypothetical protein
VLKKPPTAKENQGCRRPTLLTTSPTATQTRLGCSQARPRPCPQPRKRFRPKPPEKAAGRSHLIDHFVHDDADAGVLFEKHALRRRLADDVGDRQHHHAQHAGHCVFQRGMMKGGVVKERKAGGLGDRQHHDAPDAGD